MGRHRGTGPAWTFAFQGVPSQLLVLACQAAGVDERWWRQRAALLRHQSWAGHCKICATLKSALSTLGDVPWPSASAYVIRVNLVSSMHTAFAVLTLAAIDGERAFARWLCPHSCRLRQETTFCRPCFPIQGQRRLGMTVTLLITFYLRDGPEACYTIVTHSFGTSPL